MATSETWNDKASGERKEKTEWHRVVIFDQRVGETVEKYLKKGSRALIEGKLVTRKYTNKDGVEQSTTEVTVEQYRGQLLMLDRAAGGGDRSESRQAAAPAARPAPAARTWESPSTDDEIPF
jgi:single-strand DNA-binding protein